MILVASTARRHHQLLCQLTVAIKREFKGPSPLLSTPKVDSDVL